VVQGLLPLSLKQLVFIIPILIRLVLVLILLTLLAIIRISFALVLDFIKLANAISLIRLALAIDLIRLANRLGFLRLAPTIGLIKLANPIDFTRFDLVKWIIIGSKNVILVMVIMVQARFAPVISNLLAFILHSEK